MEAVKYAEGRPRALNPSRGGQGAVVVAGGSEGGGEDEAGGAVAKARARWAVAARRGAATAQRWW